MNLNGKTIRRTILSVFLAFLLGITFCVPVFAEETMVTTVGELKAETPEQKFTIQIGQQSFSTCMKDMGDTPVVVQKMDDGTVNCAVTDATILEGWIESINDFLEQSTDVSTGNLYYDPAANAFTTLAGSTYSKISNLGVVKVISAFQEQLINSDGGEKKVTLSGEDLESKNSEVPDGFVLYTIKGTCTTDYSDSSSNRINNIKTAAANINMMIIEPGQTVSMNQAFKPRTEANGYRLAGVYSNGETILGIGGGICQVSSTVYNAAMNSGLTVVERYPHSMPVHYLPLGLDAAISSGSKDLKVRNDFSFPVVVGTITTANSLTVNIYTDAAQTAGLGYRLHSVTKSARSAVTYLEMSVNGIVVEDRYIGSSSYR